MGGGSHSYPQGYLFENAGTWPLVSESDSLGVGGTTIHSLQQVLRNSDQAHLEKCWSGSLGRFWSQAGRVLSSLLCLLISLSFGASWNLSLFLSGLILSLLGFFWEKSQGALHTPSTERVFRKGFTLVVHMIIPRHNRPGNVSDSQRQGQTTLS